MKKLCIVIIVVLSKYSSSLGQDSINKKSPIVNNDLLFISGGLAVPKGDFTENAYPANGYDISINYKHSLGSVVGISTRVRLISNPRDKQQILEDNLYGFYNSTPDIESGNFSRYSILAGLVFSIPISTLSLDFNGYVGPAYLTYPHFHMSVPPYASINIDSYHKLSLAYGTNISLMNVINDKYYIGIAVDYSFSKATFTDVTGYLQTNVGNQFTNVYDLPLNINALSLLINFGIKLK